jgi:uncharacterized protein YjiS (DUF1127 family)
MDMTIYITPQMITPAFDGRERDESIGIFRRLFRSAIIKWQRRKMTAALEALDDRILRDIGICRREIPRVVDGLSHRELRMAPLASTATSVGAEHEANLKAA